MTVTGTDAIVAGIGKAVVPKRYITDIHHLVEL